MNKLKILISVCLFSLGGICHAGFPTLKTVQLSTVTPMAIQSGTTGYWMWIDSGTINQLTVSTLTLSPGVVVRLTSSTISIFNTSTMTQTNVGEARFTQTSTSNSQFVGEDLNAKTSAGVAQRWIYGQNLIDSAGTFAVRDQTQGVTRIAISTSSGRVVESGGNASVALVNTDQGYCSSTNTAAIINAPGTTGVFGNIVSVSLPAGNYTLTGFVEGNLNGAGGNTFMNYALSAFSGNTTTDHVEGYNASSDEGPTAGINRAYSIPRWIVNPTTTTTYYLKSSQDYSSGTPRVYGTLTYCRQ